MYGGFSDTTVIFEVHKISAIVCFVSEGILLNQQRYS
jgi:hypothetical protein